MLVFFLIIALNSCGSDGDSGDGQALDGYEGLNGVFTNAAKETTPVFESDDGGRPAPMGINGLYRAVITWLDSPLHAICEILAEDEADAYFNIYKDDRG